MSCFFVRSHFRTRQTHTEMMILRKASCFGNLLRSRMLMRIEQLSTPSLSAHHIVFRYDAPHTHGCLFSGAGGGFLMVISDTPVEGGLKIKVCPQPRICPRNYSHTFFCVCAGEHQPYLQTFSIRHSPKCSTPYPVYVTTSECARFGIVNFGILYFIITITKKFCC